MLTVGFCNLKGGVGKTTACQNLAAALAQMGKKVAVIDMDPQSNLSTSFGINITSGDPQVFDLLQGDASWDDVKVTREGIDIIPSSLDLVMVEFNTESSISRDSMLRDAIKQLPPDRYDFLLLDSPPQLSIFTRNVLTACSSLIVPMDGGFYGLAGLRLLNDVIPAFRERLNPELKMTGILMTHYNPKIFISREVHDEIANFFGPLLFESYIHQNVGLIEAASLGVSIYSYAKNSRGALEYMAVANEFLIRCTKEKYAAKRRNARSKADKAAKEV